MKARHSLAPRSACVPPRFVGGFGASPLRSGESPRDDDDDDSLPDPRPPLGTPPRAAARPCTSRCRCPPRSDRSRACASPSSSVRPSSRSRARPSTRCMLGTRRRRARARANANANVAFGGGECRAWRLAVCIMLRGAGASGVQRPSVVCRSEEGRPGCAALSCGRARPPRRYLAALTALYDKHKARLCPGGRGAERSLAIL